MDERKPVVAHADMGHGSVLSYVIGFVLSILLTLVAYVVVYLHTHTSHEEFSHLFLRIVIAVTAVIQLFVQLIFFLHMGRESKPRWNLMMLLFAVMVVFIVVAGSLWIMNNLNYNMNHLSPSQMNLYMHNNEGL